MTFQNITPISHGGGTGADIKDWLSWFDTNLTRHHAATALADAVLKCDAEDRLPFIEAIHHALSAVFPGPLFGSIMAEAAFWADRASHAERKAYCLACYNRMPAREQSAFLDYVQGRSAA